MEKMKYIFIFLILIFSNAYSNQSSSVDTYLELREYKEYDYAEKVIRATFNGLIEGIIYTDVATGISNGEKNVNSKIIKHFFCIPPNQSINGRDLQIYVDDYIAKNKIKGEEPLVSIALLALKENYPCGE